MLHYLFLKSDSERCSSQNIGAIPRPHLLYTPCQDIPQDRIDISEFQIKGFKCTTPTSDNNDWRIPGFFFQGGDLIISLSDLISSSPGIYRQKDSIKIAISLIRALLFFHTTPWINNLRLDKIRLYQVSDPLFKVKHEFKGLHMPVSPILSSEIHNPHSVRDMGLILLQLGNRKLFDIDPESGEPRDLQKILQSEHYGVYQSTGKHYWNVVRKMMRAGNSLMDDQHMEAFLSDIAGLENQADHYTPKLLVLPTVS